MAESDVAFYDDGSIVAKWAVGVLACLFGVMGVLSAISRVRYSVEGDEIFLLVLGTAFLVFGYCWLRFSTNPRLRLSSKDLTLRRFWSVQRWRYEEIKSVSVKPEIIKPKVNTGGRVVKMTPKRIEKIWLGLQDGSKTSFVAPAFVSNDRLLNELSMRCNLPVERIPMDED